MMDTIRQFALILAAIIFVLWASAQVLIRFMKVSDEKAKEELAKDNCSDCPKDDCASCPAEEHGEGLKINRVVVYTQCPSCGDWVEVGPFREEIECGMADVSDACLGCGQKLRVVLDGVKVLKIEKENIIQTYHISGGEEVEKNGE